MQHHVLTHLEQLESSPPSATQLKEPPKSSEEWGAIIRGWEQSGLSQKAYCEQHNMKLHNFVYHRKKHQSDQRSTSRFSQIKITGKSNSSENPTGLYRLKLPNGITLLIPPQFESSSLKELFQLLGVIEC